MINLNVLSFPVYVIVKSLLYQFCTQEGKYIWRFSLLPRFSHIVIPHFNRKSHPYILLIDGDLTLQYVIL